MSRTGVAPLVAVAMLGSLAVGTVLMRGAPPAVSPGADSRAVAPPPVDASEPSAVDSTETCDPALELVAPTGRPAGISCSAARAVVREVGARFAAPVVRPPAPLFAELLVSWLDPHGLWSDAPDAPTAARLEADGAALLAEIELDPASSEPCARSLSLGGTVASWVDELGVLYDHARGTAPAVSAPAAATLALQSPFDDASPVLPARKLAADLGRDLGAVERALGRDVSSYAGEARARYLPKLAAEEWAEVVLASAVRAYVAALDPHGQWTPIDEEWALYADDESFEDADRLWGDMLRTAVGVRVVDRPSPPLAVDDLVLAVNGVSVAGMAVEQVGQLVRATLPAGTERSVVVLRAGFDGPRTLDVSPLEPAPPDDPAADAGDDELALEFVPYGAGQVAVVAIRYVGDDLGPRLEDLIEEIGELDERPVGMLLDLRGNGGGSTDGAAEALGVFLSGVPAFPLLHHGRVTEVLVSPTPDPGRRFEGPLAVLVDPRTASAAEMLAGALDRYGRATLLGGPTFGKGCVQEYFRDHTGAGALRLTTHLVTLPDGSSIQRAGLNPALLLDVGPSDGHEGDLPGALEPVTGPDVRVRTAEFPAWPRTRVGPCADAVVCSALRRLGGRPVAQAARSEPKRHRRTPR